MLAMQPLGGGPLTNVMKRLPAVLPTVTLRWADRGWTPLPGDVAGAGKIEGILQPITISRSIPITAGMGVLAGVALTSGGEIELDNTDGRLDLLPDQYGVEGREVRLKVASARGEWPLTQDMALLGTFVADGWEGSSATLRIATRDILSALDRPVSTSTYGGTGGLSGSPEVKGLTRPFGMGRVRNARALLIDPNQVIYQVHDGACRSITEVRDKAVPLRIAGQVDTYQELEEVSVEAGEVVVCPTVGCFKLGDFASGLVTCDFRGDGAEASLVSGYWEDGGAWEDDAGLWEDRLPTNAYTEYAAGMLIRLITVRAGISRRRLDSGQFKDLERQFPYPLQLFVPAGENKTVLQCCEEIAEAAGVVVTTNRVGLIYPRRIAIPREGTLIVDEDIVEGSFERIRVPYGRPIYSASVPYGQNQTIMSDQDMVTPGLASGGGEDPDSIITSEDLEPWKQQYQGKAEGGSSRTLHRVQNARSVNLEPSVLATEEGARVRAKEIPDLHGADRIAFRFTVKRKAWRVELGDGVKLQSDRYGLKNGRFFLVTAITDSPLTRAVTLEVVG